ncbi:TetR/AcrR family transcriptional regulator [Salirhabdus sp. Marseille-P4669]|uniref:TetR/AcrR family transcriptional regulator n=1 Tax=Salirhabdus sp. Marseille-P4669 TaxID=2042310 RepID=UPI000C7B7518|nr:TetR/AcrR family transcriptional regulator [Salirhabdus sp. Marseille-P4669]
MNKKQIIIDKALELFAEHGFAATSVQQITEKCGISKGAFYLVFKSKDELVLAIIDQFMRQITSDIDWIVKNEEMDDKLLYRFYYANFQSLKQYSNFAKAFMKEQSHTLNEELLRKVQYYNKILDETISYMVERLYGNQVKGIKYDLVYSIKGFLKNYTELFLFFDLPIDLDRLCTSLAEKTEILAKYTTIPFMSDDFLRIYHSSIEKEVSTDSIIEMINESLEGMEESIKRESLQLIKEELTNPSLSPALKRGLLENIRQDSRCKWIAYLLENFSGF